MSEFDIEIDDSSRVGKEISEINPGKKLITITIILIISAFVFYLLYTIMFAYEYRSDVIITIIGDRTDTYYNTTMAVFRNTSNVIFIVCFFTLGIIFLSYKKEMSKGKGALTAASFFAAFSLAFGITAIFVINYRTHYIQRTSLDLIDYLVRIFTDEVLLATGPIADAGKYLMMTISLVIIGFASKGFVYIKDPKVKTSVSPWFLLVSILLWIGVLIGIYVVIINDPPDRDEILKTLFLTTNINQTIMAALGILSFTELLVKIRKTT